MFVPESERPAYWAEHAEEVIRLSSHRFGIREQDYLKYLDAFEVAIKSIKGKLE